MVWRRMPSGASRSDSQVQEERAPRNRRLQHAGGHSRLSRRRARRVVLDCAARQLPKAGRTRRPGRTRADSVWSIVCFFVPRRLRGKGMTRRLIEAAVDHARAEGSHSGRSLSRRSDLSELSFHGVSGHIRGDGLPRGGSRGNQKARDAAVFVDAHRFRASSSAATLSPSATFTHRSTIVPATMISRIDVTADPCIEHRRSGDIQKRPKHRGRPAHEPEEREELSTSGRWRDVCEEASGERLTASDDQSETRSEH